MPDLHIPNSLNKRAVHGIGCDYLLGIDWGFRSMVRTTQFGEVVIFRERVIG